MHEFVGQSSSQHEVAVLLREELEHPPCELSLVPIRTHLVGEENSSLLLGHRRVR